MLSHMMIRGIFEDPTDLNGLEDPTGECYDEKSQYPFPVDMIPGITKEILQIELRILDAGINDTSNDTIQNK